MKTPNQNTLSIQCILSSEIPNQNVANSNLVDNSVTYYTLLFSLGILRWTVERDLNQIYILDQSLKPPLHISAFIPMQPAEKKSARSIAAERRQWSTYLNEVVHNACAADANFVVFATSFMKVFQYFILEGSTRKDLNGIYIYCKHQGEYAKYEKQDNHECALVNQYWLNHTG